MKYFVEQKLFRMENGQLYIDRIERIIRNSKGTSVVLMLDVDQNPKLSSEISIENIKRNWQIDYIGTRIIIGMPEESIHFIGDIGTKILLDLPSQKSIDLIKNIKEEQAIDKSKNKFILKRKRV